MTKTPKEAESKAAPAMPFNEALKRVWAAPPMPKVKPKPAPSKSDQAKPKEGD